MQARCTELCPGSLRGVEGVDATGAITCDLPKDELRHEYPQAGPDGARSLSWRRPTATAGRPWAQGRP